MLAASNHFISPRVTRHFGNSLLGHLFWKRVAKNGVPLINGLELGLRIR